MRNTDELSALRRMHWLTDQILAKEDPITLDLIEKFGKNPGVLIPEDAIGLFRLPVERYPTSSKWTPDGVGGVIFGGCDQQKTGRLTFFCQKREYYVKPGVSVIPLGMYKGAFIRIEKDTLKEDRDQNEKLMYGDKTVLVTAFIQHALLRRDGSVLIIKQSGFYSEHLTVNLDSGDATPCRTTESTYESLVESPAGIIYGIYRDKNFDRKFGCFEQDPILNPNDKILRAVELPGNQFAQVEEARHKMERWVFKSGPHPAFQNVSAIFNHPDHDLCYMGRVGNHIVTMKVPA